MGLNITVRAELAHESGSDPGDDDECLERNTRNTMAGGCRKIEASRVRFCVTCSVGTKMGWTRTMQMDICICPICPI